MQNDQEKRLRRYEGGAEVSAAGDCVRKVGAAAGTLCGSCTNLHQTLVTLVNILRVSATKAEELLLFTCGKTVTGVYVCYHFQLFKTTLLSK